RVLGTDGEGARIAPDRTARGVDVGAAEPRARREIEIVPAVGAPARLAQGIGPTGGEIDVVHGPPAILADRRRLSRRWTGWLAMAVKAVDSVAGEGRQAG